MELPRRVLLIGLDALDHRWLRRWMAEGRLLNLSQFAEQSLSLDVASDGGLLHGSVWPTFASGTGPGHHGLYWWTQWIAEEARYERNSHGVLHYDPFWRQAALQGKRTIVVDVPYVPPVRDGHTWTALGWGLHDEVAPISYPGAFLPAIRKRYGDHPLRMDTMHSMDPAEKRKMADQMRRGVEMRARLVSDFASRQDWELLIVTFSEFHKAGHYLAADEQLGDGLTNEDAILSVLEPFDRALPEIVERAGPHCDVAIFALHGIEPQVEYSRIAAQFAALVDGRDVEAATPAPDLLRRLRDLMPPQLQQAIWYLFPPSVRARRYAQTVAQGLDGDERLFHVAHDGAVALRVNLAGRERDGTITPEERHALLSRTAEVAGTMVTSEGLPAFDPLVRMDERYPGPRAHRLPDALVPANPAVFSADDVRAPDGPILRNPQPEARNGVHSSEGFCLYRPGAKAEALRGSINALDFAPTVLARLGVTAPNDFQGASFLG
ncbi:MAG: alkaline phosphatase family protein [Dehalococcoidia bacterium]